LLSPLRNATTALLVDPNDGDGDGDGDVVDDVHDDTRGVPLLPEDEPPFPLTALPQNAAAAAVIVVVVLVLPNAAVAVLASADDDSGRRDARPAAAAAAAAAAFATTTTTTAIAAAVVTTIPRESERNFAIWYFVWPLVRKYTTNEGEKKRVIATRYTVLYNIDTTSDARRSQPGRFSLSRWLLALFSNVIFVI